jgi:hypothetical protein
LLDITWAINHQIYSTTGLSLIDIVFRQCALPAKFLTTIQQRSLPGILNKDRTYTTDQEVAQLLREVQEEEIDPDLLQCSNGNTAIKPHSKLEAYSDNDAVADQLLEKFIDTT